MTCDPGDPGEQARHAAPDHAGADDRDPVAEEGRGVPERVDRGLDRPGEHGSVGRDTVRGPPDTASAGTT